jgi:hypothetical protein
VFGVAQIALAPRRRNDVAAFALQSPYERGTGHAGVAGHKDALAAQIEFDLSLAHGASLLILHVAVRAVLVHLAEIAFYHFAHQLVERDFMLPAKLLPRLARVA